MFASVGLELKQKRLDRKTIKGLVAMGAVFNSPEYVYIKIGIKV